jgi:hypothetical protein
LQTTAQKEKDILMLNKVAFLALYVGMAAPALAMDNSETAAQDPQESAELDSVNPEAFQNDANEQLQWVFFGCAVDDAMCASRADARGYSHHHVVPAHVCGTRRVACFVAKN